MDWLKRIVVGNLLLSKIYYYYSRLVGRDALKEIERRRSLSFFNFEELSRSISYYPTSTIKDNCHYGTSEALKSGLQGFDLKNNCLIEHGLILGGFVQKHVNYSFANTVITFSAYRKEILQKKVKKRIVTVGPYIKHAKALLQETELMNIKNVLGRCLVVFPSHSIDSVEADYNIGLTIEEIERVRLLLNINTVVICMYWKDIQLQKYKPYIERGYKVTTSGHSFDHYFLNRQKSIIELADYTMSNNVGTHVGYCISLNKPHYIFNQVIHQKKLNLGFNRELSQRNDLDYLTYNEARNEILETFSEVSLEITENMLTVVEKYWGK